VDHPEGRQFPSLERLRLRPLASVVVGAGIERARFDVLKEPIRAQYACGSDRGRAPDLANPAFSSRDS
jgi:hypothetical protein